MSPAINDGITSVWSYGNIAVTVLFLCLMGSAFINFYMLRFLMKIITRVTGSLERLNKAVGHDKD